MKSFIEQAQIYAGYHSKPNTLYTHLIGVPLIIFSLMILIGYVKIMVPGVFATNLAFLATLALLAYYFRLQWQLALTLTPLLFFLLWIASFFNYTGPTRVSLWIFAITFILGWALQIAGHMMEGKKPAFMDNLCQAFIAPLYLTAEIYFMFNQMAGLKAQIHGKTD